MIRDVTNVVLEHVLLCLYSNSHKEDVAMKDHTNKELGDDYLFIIKASPKLT